MIAQTLESQLGRPAEAIEILRKTKGKMRSAAQALLDQITSRQLIIATERAFRTDEIPTVKINSRNIEQLHISVYRLDVESYFRKVRQIGGIGSLDIDLIDPDDSFVFKVPDYKRFQAAEHRVPVLPMKGKKPDRKPIAMVVTVSSKTLKATTLVLRSDLEIVVRSSRHDTLVFAQNMQTGRPWPKARVLLSDGKRIITETVTGKDGVLHQRFGAPLSNLRIFAVANGHVAATHGDMTGPKMAKTTRNAGYAYTDRPIYQPGEMVHLKGVVGRSIGSKDKLRIRIFDPQNREILNQHKQVSAFGTIASRVQLSDAARQGTYRLLLTKDGDNRTTFTRQFTVKKYKLNQVRLEVVLDSPVVFRGEKISGTIRATHYHGTPLANTPIQYQLIGIAQKTKLTDKRGELRFEFSAPESRASTLIEHLTAYLPSRNIRQQVKVVIAEREFDLQVSTIRKVFLANEPFEVSVTTKGVAGRQIKPSRPIQLSVFAMTEVQGKVGTKLLRTIQIPIKAAAVQRATIKLAKGGRYVLQASTADRRGTRVVGETAIGVSDESDQKRLRILGNRKRWALGDEAKTTIVWREKPALALVTLQADQLIQYQLVQLQRGRNAYRIPIFQELSPNFQLSVSVINDRRHRARDGRANALPQEHWIAQSTTEFTVEKGLDIRLRTARGAKPGSPLTITMQTRDRRKRPVAAEVSLAVIDKSLLDSYGIKGDIVSAFAWPRRTMSVRSTSSIRFGYSPTTSLINPRLLAESERKKLTALELKKLSQWRTKNARNLGGGMGGGGMGGGFFGGAGFGAPESRSRNRTKMATGGLQWAAKETS